MNSPDSGDAPRGKPPSPWVVVSLVINAICFGGCLVLLVLGTVGGPLVLLTLGTGLSTGAGGATMLKLAGRRRQEAHRHQSPVTNP